MELPGVVPLGAELPEGGTPPTASPPFELGAFGGGGMRACPAPPGLELPPPGMELDDPPDGLPWLGVPGDPGLPGKPPGLGNPPLGSPPLGPEGDGDCGGCG